MRFRLLVVLLALAGTTCSLQAQGLRVSTHIYDTGHRNADGRATVVSGSLSLFHNGRVYDYVDSAEEVVIFDPVERRFTILNMARDISTTVDFDEMNHLLESRIPVTEQLIQELKAAPLSESRRVAESLQFQLHPKFQQTYEAATGMLTLSSSVWTYRVTTHEWPEAEQVERYLTYADWTARLNHILHPSSLFPEPRVELNRVLRELHGRMPVVVELNLNGSDPLQLRAEHRFTHNLTDDDRRRIAGWDQTLSSGNMRAMSFRSYQQTVLVTQNR